jgi:hypothetical protein
MRLRWKIILPLLLGLLAAALALVYLGSLYGPAKALAGAAIALSVLLAAATFWARGGPR